MDIEMTKVDLELGSPNSTDQNENSPNQEDNSATSPSKIATITTLPKRIFVGIRNRIGAIINRAPITAGDATGGNFALIPSNLVGSNANSGNNNNNNDPTAILSGTTNAKNNASPLAKTVSNTPPRQLLMHFAKEQSGDAGNSSESNSQPTIKIEEPVDNAVSYGDATSNIKNIDTKASDATKKDHEQASNNGDSTQKSDGATTQKETATKSDDGSSKKETTNNADSSEIRIPVVKKKNANKTKMPRNPNAIPLPYHAEERSATEGDKIESKTQVVETTSTADNENRTPIIGDRVEVIDLINEKELNGSRGTVVFIENDLFFIRFDDKETHKYSFDYRKKKTWREFIWMDRKVKRENLSLLPETKRVNIDLIEENFESDRRNWILGGENKRYPPFIPRYEWKSVTKGSPVEAGLDIKMNIEKGGSMARIPRTDMVNGVRDQPVPPLAT